MDALRTSFMTGRYRTSAQATNAVLHDLDVSGHEDGSTNTPIIQQKGCIVRHAAACKWGSKTLQLIVLRRSNPRTARRMFTVCL